MKVDGHCLCGHLRYEAEIDPDRVEICNCVDCQTLSGSAFRVNAPVIDGAFNLMAGEMATYVKIAASGNGRELGFCPKCGTSVYSRPAGGQPGFFGLRVGSLSQRRELVPKARYWRESAQPWVDNIADIPAFCGN